MSSFNIFLDRLVSMLSLFYRIGTKNFLSSHSRFQRPGFDPNSLQDGVNIMSRLYLNECIIFAPKFLIKSTIVAKNILNTKKL